MLLAAKLVDLQERLCALSRQRREQRRAQVKAGLLEKRAARPFIAGEIVMVRRGQDESASSKKLAHKSEGPFTVMGPGPHPNTLRVMMSRGDIVLGNIVHVENIKHLDPCETRYFYDPTPNTATEFASAEDGSMPGSMGLLPEELVKLAEVLGGSQPLVPTDGGRSEHCYVCRKKQLLKAGADARVPCAFCNGFAHATCLFTAGSARVAEKLPAIFRCNNCVLELPEAFKFVREKTEKLHGEMEAFQLRLDELAEIKFQRS